MLLLKFTILLSKCQLNEIDSSYLAWYVFREFENALNRSNRILN